MTTQSQIDMKRSAAERLLMEAAELEARLAAMPTEPNFEDGASVVCFKKTFNEGGRVYDYAAIRVKGVWYTTGPQAARMGLTYSWQSLVEFADEGTIWFACEWEEVE
jgi:hypothetical protein